MRAAICLRLCLLFLRISRWVPIVIVFIISAFVYYAYCFYTVHALTDQWNVRIALISVFHVLLFMFLFAYLSAVMNSVPKMPSKFYLPASVVELELSIEKSDYGRNVILYRHAMENALPIENVSLTNGPRYCPVCKCIKADRCHHCSLCSACVLKYDHHCPWINNCVHHRNYKSFVLFLFYGLTLCVFVLLSSLPTLIIQWNEEAKSYLLIQKFIMVFLPFCCTSIWMLIRLFTDLSYGSHFQKPHNHRTIHATAF
ncbi:hypothetical protein M3Y94_00384600 [Aphelenchoides besseyi]|nr:hypothetical protein M3Y94_00384600 [Aphelenchoides besseyi]